MPSDAAGAPRRQSSLSSRLLTNRHVGRLLADRQTDFLDLQVLPHRAVSALTEQRGVRRRGARAQLLPEEVAPAAALEVVGGSAPRRTRRSATQRMRARFHWCRSSRPGGSTPNRRVLPGQDQTRTGIPSRVAAIPTMT